MRGVREFEKILNLLKLETVIYLLVWQGVCVRIAFRGTITQIPPPCLSTVQASYSKKFEKYVSTLLHLDVYTYTATATCPRIFKIGYL